jgi:hypothetical protein
LGGIIAGAIAQKRFHIRGFCGKFGIEMTLEPENDQKSALYQHFRSTIHVRFAHYFCMRKKII